MRIVYGINPILEILSGDAQELEKIVLAKGRGGQEAQKIVDLARKKGIRVEFSPREELDHLAGRKSQGVVGYCRQFRYSGLDEVLANRRPGLKNSLILLLDSVTDPQNLGSLIRTAFYFGANGVVIPEDRSATVTSAAVKASAGAAGRLPVARVVNLARTLDELKEAGYWIYGTDSHSEHRLEEVDFSGHVGLVMGSEGSGIRPLVRKKCDLTLSIPGTGEFDSLNVSVAAGIILHRVSLTRAGS